MKKTFKWTVVRGSIGLAVILAVIAGCTVAPEPSITPEEAQAIAKDAYIYGFPMVMKKK